MAKPIPPSSSRFWCVAGIVVGQRHRRDLGDIAGLAASIAEIGLLNPIVIRPDGTLIAGERRLRAVESLSREQIEVTIVDLDEIARGEFAENVHRKDFTPSELVAIGREVERIERDRAKIRKAHDGRAGKLPERQTGDARDKIAAQLGTSGRTYEKMRAVVEAGEAEPERFGKLVADMDRSGRVNGVYKRLKNIEQAAAIRAEPPPLPDGRFHAGMIDIPWAYELDDETAPHRGVLPYPTMSIEQACSLDVASILHDDSIVGMWVTNFVLVRAHHLPVLHAWGLEPKTLITWPKDRIGRGHWAKGQTEHLVIATRGNPIVTLTDQTTLLKGPFHLVQKNTHSAKPIEAYSYFESLCPAPRYFDLFSRYRHSDKWVCYGDEAPSIDPESGVDGVKALDEQRGRLVSLVTRRAAPSGHVNPEVAPSPESRKDDLDIGLPEFLRRVAFEQPESSRSARTADEVRL
jgi:N6-adenosine-specific RNA methylase IME4